MGDSHQMIVHNVCEVVGWITVRLDQNHVIKLAVVNRDVSVNLIVEGRGSLRRVVLTDNKWLALCQICLDLLFGQMQAVLIIGHDLLAVYNVLQRVQTLLIAEAVVSLSFFDQLLCILHVNTGLLALTLHIRTATAVLIRTLIMDQTGLFQSAVNDLRSALNVTLLVGILNTQKEISSLMFCNQICIQRGTQISYMHTSCRAWCISCTNLSHIHSPRISVLLFVFSFPVFLLF